jgi:carboxylesterase type B
MVLWGQSAGAGAVDSYAYAHPKDAIVSGLIADSGSASLSTGPAPAGVGFSTLAGIVGCGNMNASAELECMQGVPATMLQNVLQGPATTANNVTVPRFGPQADNVTVFANNTERIEQGLVATVVSIG